jgi:membrane-associated protease RseP (regulator of RpoE activity)
MKDFLRPYSTKNPKFWLTGALIVGLSSVSSALAQSSQTTQILEHPWLLLSSHSQGLLGVYVGDVDQERAQTLHLKEARGAEITILDHDAPAAKVGLRLHDVILQMNGQTIENADQVRRMLREIPPGRKVQLVVSRDGAQQTVSVQMADRRKVQEEAWEQLGSSGGSSAPANSFVSGGDTAPVSQGFHFWALGSSLHVGALVEPLTPQMAEFLGVSGGLMIKNVAHKSAADAAGLKPHDVILGVGGEPVATSSDWERLLRTSEGKPVQVEIFRDRAKQLVLLQVDGKRHKT